MYYFYSILTILLAVGSIIIVYVLVKRSAIRKEIEERKARQNKMERNFKKMQKEIDKYFKMR